MSTELTAEQARTRETLRGIFPKGSTVTTIVRHVSQSGMQRAIQVLGVYGGNVDDVTYLVVAAGIGKRHPRQPGLKVDGMGMDMAWHTAYRIAEALYGDGYALNNRTL